MNTPHIQSITAAAFILALALPAAAQQGGKSKGEKALDTVVKILDIFGGKGTGQSGKAPVIDPKLLAAQSAAFAGTYGGNGIQAQIQSSGPACFIQLGDMKGSYAGIGLPVDGFLPACFNPEKRGGVWVYRVQGTQLRGVGVSYIPGGKTVGMSAEVLEGPANLNGTYRITSGSNPVGIAYSGSCVIRPTGNNNYHLTWTIGAQQVFGMGFVTGTNLWVAWSPTRDFFLTVFERRPGDPKTLLRHTLINNGLPPADLAEVRLIDAPRAGAPIAANIGKPGNNPGIGQFAPAMNNGGGGGFAPAMNNPAGNPAPQINRAPDGKNVANLPGARGAPAPMAAPGAAPGVPAKGPLVGKADAAKQLKSDMDGKIAEFMKLHNDARAEVGVAPLQWDPKLAAYAQEWADKIGASGRMEHRPNGKYGENLAGYLPQYGERPVHGAKMWYDEIKDYRGRKIGEPGTDKVGHYTQMVWRASTRVGFGIAMTKNGMVMLCANYDPAGNMIGEHPYEGGAVVPAAFVADAGGAVPPPAMAPNRGLEKPIDFGGGAPAPAVPVVAGIGLQLQKDWTNTKNGDVISSIAPDGTAGVFLKPVGSSEWDTVQAEMAQHLVPLLPGLTDLAEVSTEHDVFRDGVGLRVVTYTGVLNGAATRIVVDFARQNNVDDNGLLLIVRFADEGADANAAKAQQVAESLQLKKK